MKPEQLTERYASCPTSQAEYAVCGRKYIVTRHFTSDKNIGQTVADLAVRMANREAGLN